MTEAAIVKPSENVALVQRVLDGGLEVYTPERIALIARTVAPPGTTPDELALFLSFCQARDLNPLMKQVYLIKDKGGRVSIVTGIDGLRLLAQRSGEYEGQVGPEWRESPDSPWDDVPPEDNLYACRVGVLRTGFKQPIYATVRFSEFVKTESWAVNWRDRPAHMIAIRAESHALRKAFPAETAGVTVHYEGGVQVEGAAFQGDPDLPIMYPQLKPLHAMARDQGWSRDERLKAAGEFLGRDVKSFSGLTRGEAHALIQAWHELEAPREGSDGETAGSTPTGDETSRAGNVEEAVADLRESGPAGPPGEPERASSRNVSGGRAKGKRAASAPEPSETGPEDDAAGVTLPEVSDPSVAEAPLDRGSTPGPSDDADQSPAAPATSHQFVGDGLLCEVCKAAEQHEDHR